jgi:hypothetical protein
MIYATPNFYNRSDTPLGDVLIAKDVLQHLSNVEILKLRRFHITNSRFLEMRYRPQCKIEYIPLPFGLSYRRRLAKCNGERNQRRRESSNNGKPEAV